MESVYSPVSELTIHLHISITFFSQIQEMEFLQKESGKTVGNVNQLESEKISLEHKVGVLEKSLEQQSQVHMWFVREAVSRILDEKHSKL